MANIVVLPLDDRPVTYDYPRWLGQAAGLNVILPPREWLGNPWRDSAAERLRVWLADEAPGADGVIVSLDTLGYGGLIPSRRSPASVEETLAHLEILRTLKQQHPDLRILAVNVLLRISRSDSAEEERPYFATYGRRLFRLSYLSHKTALNEASAAEQAEYAALTADVPAEVIADYRALRTRNHAINRAMLGWLKDDVFDYLLIPQDDTAEYGWNIAEARALRSLIETDGLANRASVYPGADEVSLLLLARFACQQSGFAPHVWTRYSGVNGPCAVTVYEDRPFEEMIKAHLGPLGGVLVGSPEQANLTVMVNAPAELQTEATWQLAVRSSQEEVNSPDRAAVDSFAAEDIRTARREMESVGRDLNDFARAISLELSSSRPVVLVNVAFVNGADLALSSRLLRDVDVARLAAYAAWNTAGNSLGCALAQGIARAIAVQRGGTHEQLAAHLGFLLLRFIDDSAFQSDARSLLMLRDLPELGIAPTMLRLSDIALPEVTRRLAEHLKPQIDAWERKFIGQTLPFGPGQSVTVQAMRLTQPYLPWGRLFEVGLTPEVELG